MPRLFVSVDLPDRLADAVGEIQDPIRDVESLRFTDPTQAHCTLKFLGDVPKSRVGAVVDALETAVDSVRRSPTSSRTQSGDDADVGPFEVEVGRLGAFPSPEYISVIWAGVRDGSAELTALAEAVDRETVAIGFDPADHAFTPHITLARMDDARGKARVQEYLDSDPTVGRFQVREVRLTESTLTDEGPHYETRARASL